MANNSNCQLASSCIQLQLPELLHTAADLCARHPAWSDCTLSVQHLFACSTDEMLLLPGLQMAVLGVLRARAGCQAAARAVAADIPEALLAAATC